MFFHSDIINVIFPCKPWHNKIDCDCHYTDIGLCLTASVTPATQPAGSGFGQWKEKRNLMNFLLTWGKIRWIILILKIGYIWLMRTGKQLLVTSKAVWVYFTKMAKVGGKLGRPVLTQNIIFKILKISYIWLMSTGKQLLITSKAVWVYFTKMAKVGGKLGRPVLTQNIIFKILKISYIWLMSTGKQLLVTSKAVWVYFTKMAKVGGKLFWTWKIKSMNVDLMLKLTFFSSTVFR